MLFCIINRIVAEAVHPFLNVASCQLRDDQEGGRRVFHRWPLATVAPNCQSRTPTARASTPPRLRLRKGFSLVAQPMPIEGSSVTRLLIGTVVVEGDVL